MLRGSVCVVFAEAWKDECPVELASKGQGQPQVLKLQAQTHMGSTPVLYLVAGSKRQRSREPQGTLCCTVIYRQERYLIVGTSSQDGKQIVLQGSNNDTFCH
jgi:hypothetical protein